MLGEALRLIRVFHDVKLIELAKELRISCGYLSEIENQKKMPTVDLIQKYSSYFQIPPSSILFFKEELESDRNKLKNGLRNKIIKFFKIIENISSNV